MKKETNEMKENKIKKILDGGTVKAGPECDAAISSRVRIARNFSDFPFPGRLDAGGRKKVVELVNNAIKGKNGYDFIDFSALSPLETSALMEKRAISPDFIKAPAEKELITDAENGLYVMVNEEDHLRIQSIKPGFSISEAYEGACKFDDLADESLSYAYDENFGYLTQCPTNLGTGMRASVMLHLPALTLGRKIQNIAAGLSKMGLTIRGFYGEGTEIGGDLYQVSNNITLGISEEQTLDKIKNVAEKIIELERADRNEIMRSSKTALTDRIKRAYGTLKNAYMIQSSEFLQLYSAVRLGIACGIIKDIDYALLDMLLANAMPANLILRFAVSDDTAENRDILRAQYIQSSIGGEKGYDAG